MLLAEWASLWRSDPAVRRLFWTPALAGFVAYVLLGMIGWLALAPVLENWLGEWEIVGRFLALGLWLSFFQFVYVLVAGIAAEAIHEPLAARVEHLRAIPAPLVRTPSGVWLVDSLLRVMLVASVTACVVVAGAWMPWLAPGVVVMCTGWGAVAAGAGVCAHRHGVRFGAVLARVMWPLDRRLLEAVVVCGLAGVFPLLTPVVLPLATALGSLLFLERQAAGRLPA